VSRVRFYLDEHVGNAVVYGLRRRGVDVVTVADVGMKSRTDEDHLALAFNASRTIFTQDGDFLRLAASGVSHAGIVYAPQGTPIGTIVSGLLIINNVLSAEELVDRIEYI
jgi:predicted nuclease of predicted toxin-antitoxin system